MIKESTPNTSVYALCISVIRELLKERNFALVKISRDANVASHELARVGRVVYHRAQVWLMNFPVESSDAITNDCNFSKFNTYLFHRKNCNSTISSVYLRRRSKSGNNPKLIKFYMIHTKRYITELLR
jgi:hypothetical protein